LGAHRPQTAVTASRCGTLASRPVTLGKESFMPAPVRRLCLLGLVGASALIFTGVFLAAQAQPSPPADQAGASAG
jgi:hypothetical protein